MDRSRSEENEGFTDLTGQGASKYCIQDQAFRSCPSSELDTKWNSRSYPRCHMHKLLSIDRLFSSWPTRYAFFSGFNSPCSSKDDGKLIRLSRLGHPRSSDDQRNR